MKCISLFLIYFFILFFLPNNLTAQGLCANCNCEEDVAADNAEFSADLSAEEGGEMSLSESDIVGSEVGSEIATDVGEEIGVELSTEMLATSFLDVIPGVGEVISALVFMGTLVYELFKMKRIEQLKAEHDVGNILSGGNHNFPLVPSFSYAVDDLNGAKDTLSYVLFLNKKTGAKDVKNYLESHGLTQHMNKTYHASLLNNHMAYAFTRFSTFTKKPDPSGNRIPKVYSHVVPDINFIKKDDGKWHYQYNPEWSHQIDYTYRTVSREPNKPIPPPGCVSCTEKNIKITKETRNTLYTSYKRTVQDTISFWIASKTASETFKYIRKLTDSEFHIEETPSQLVVRINNLFVSSATITDTLYIAMNPIKKFKNYLVDKSGKKVFPENYDPRESDIRYYHSVTKKKEDGSNYENPVTKTQALDDDGIYPNTKGKNLAFDTHNMPFFYFKIHDYQMRDNESSMKKKEAENKIGDINMFPDIKTWGVTTFKKKLTLTKYINTSISNPQKGKSHLRLDIPLKSGLKPIEHVELEAINHSHTVIVKLLHNKTIDPILVGASAWYNDSETNIYNAHTDVKKIELKTVYKYLNDKEWVIQDSPTTTYSKTPILKDFNLMILNAPFAPGDLINVSTYYEDKSVSRKIIQLNAVSNNVVQRAYYNIRDQYSPDSSQFRNLHYNETTNEVKISTGNSQKSQWLIERSSHNDYAIMHKKSKKVLGIMYGKVGVYHWSPENENLLWRFEYDGEGKAKLENVGQQVYLTTNTPTHGDILVADPWKGSNFYIEKAAEAEPIFPIEAKYIINTYTGKALDTDKKGNAFFLPQKIYSSTVVSNTQMLTPQYVGCLHYNIHNSKNNKYLYYLDSRNITWSSSSKTAWHINKLASDKFTITTKGLALFNQNNNSTIAKSYNSSITTEQRFLFKMTKSPEYYNSHLLAYYPLDENGKDFSQYGHDASIVKNVTFVDDPDRGGVAQFVGNGHLDTGFDFNPKNYGGKMTISCWVKASNWGSTQAGYNARILSSSAWALGRDEWLSKVSFADYIKKMKASGGNFSDNQWHHLIATIDQKNNLNKLYIDGQLTAQASTTSIHKDHFWNTTIGGSKVFFDFTGLIDEIKIWDKILTVNNIAAISRDQIIVPQKTSNSDLIAHYPLDSNGNDLSIYENHSTITGTISFTTDIERGKVALFTGTGHLDTGFDFNPKNYGGRMTISCWVKPSDWGSNDSGYNARILSSRDWALGRKEWSSNVSFDDYINKTKAYTGNFNGNQWQHLVAVIQKNGKNKLYINGKLSAVATSTTNVFRDHFWNTTIGGSKVFFDYKGMIDEIKIWDGVLDSLAVRKLFQGKPINIIPNPENDLLAYYSLDRSGEDLSNYKNHAKLIGIVSFVEDIERGKVAKFTGNGHLDTGVDFNPKNYGNNMTISCWVKPFDWNNKSSGYNARILSSRTWVLGRDEWSSRVSFVNFNKKSKTIGKKIDDNQWHHLVVVLNKKDDNSNLLYIDGELFAQTTSSNTVFQDHYWETTIGASKVFFDYKGLIDEIKIWRKAFQADAIKKMYLSQKKEVSKNLWFENSNLYETNKTTGNLIVYPNESNGVFQIAMEVNRNQAFRYRIISMEGRIIIPSKKEILLEKGRHVLKIDASHLQNGIYLLEIITEQWIQTKTLVISKE